MGATARHAGPPGWPGGRRRRWASSTTRRSMPAWAARAVSSGRATSVSRATTARRWTSNGLKSGPWSRATSASRASSSSTKTWWYFLHSSPSHCTVSVSGATTRHRSARPVRRRRLRTRQASIVLPRPTSSARSQRTGSAAAARSAAWSWWGKSRMRPPRKEPRPSASRREARCRPSRRRARSSTGSTSPLARRSTRSDLGSVGPGSSGARGTRAAPSLARRRVTSPAGNSTRTDRPSTDTTRPGPSSGLWRCVRRSPTFHIRAL